MASHDLDMATVVVRNKIEEVSFGFYTDADVRNRSVVEVNSSITFDSLGNPLPRGLYDPRMGPQSNSPGPGSSSSCCTCGNPYMYCPGHCGHIELCVPVYHILTFPKLLQLLKSKCLFCHNLRVSQHMSKIFATKIHLLDEGFINEALNLDNTIGKALKSDGLDRKGQKTKASRQGKTSSSTEDGKSLSLADMIQGNTTSSANRESAGFDGAGLSELDRVLQHCQSKRKNSLLTKSKKQPPSTLLTSHERSLRREIIREFLQSCTAAKACSNCNAFSPKIRHDSHNKIFCAPLSDRQRTHNLGYRKRLRPALEFLSTEKKKGHLGNSLIGNQGDEEKRYDSSDSDDDEDDDDLELGELIENQAEEDDGRNAKKSASTSGGDKYMHTLEVEAQVKLTWRTAGPKLCCYVFGMPDVDLANYEVGYQMFFLRALTVPPNRFRPAMHLGTVTAENPQNSFLARILVQNQYLIQNLDIIRNNGEDDDSDDNNDEKNENKNRSLLEQTLNNKKAKISKSEAHRRLYINWIEIQTCVNTFFDSDKDPKAYSAETPGIKQLLEKKEGLFRRNLMGKRVDFACRSVISPDPYVGTNEIGIPVVFARTLSYPTPVNMRNVTEMRRLVSKGPHTYPGANWVQHPNGQRFDLARMNSTKREALAATLLSKEGGQVLVGRQLRDGDMLLMNRQPTLHKPGIMAHRIRVLYNPEQKTIRMHYANCNTYNADYDGDEMNGHFPQNTLAHAEAHFIMNTDLQYISPTDGGALRGLIQDNVDGGVQMCNKDTFFERWEYQQLLMAALASLPGLELIRSDAEIQIMPPAIRKPRELWTGKQVISGLLQHLRLPSDRDVFTAGDSILPGLSMELKAKTPDHLFGKDMEEHLVLIRDGELLRGVLDKGAFGAADYSVVHAVYEAYGPEKAGLLLNAFCRLFTSYVQSFSGHSCRMEDLVLTPQADRERKELLQKAYNQGSRAAKAWADSQGGKVEIQKYAEAPDANDPLKVHEVATTSAKLQDLLSGHEGKENGANLDAYMQSQLNPIASQIIKKCLPSGLAVPFPKNTFSLMVNTGAKGSMVNQSQVSCSLGQQALEGRRVPRMSSGRTLPSFAPYDPSPRADGFITDRFLSGIRPQEYYFHCMAGREGLVDTAVKTSRSGYLQRCLMKHLEEVKVSYDSTVRDSEGGVVQFLYGEDGIDATKAPYLECSPKSLTFLARNMDALKKRYHKLPKSGIDLAAQDAELAENAPQSTNLKKGAFVKARKLRRKGSAWDRGNLCQGWFDAIIVKCHDDGEHFDVKYLDSDAVTKNIPKQVTLSRCGGRHTAAVGNTITLIQPSAPDPIISGSSSAHGRNLVGQSGACVSEKVATEALSHLKVSKDIKHILKANGAQESDFSSLVASKYSSALCAPGEAVGCIAAQGIGEPSTQMTLNTFHLAGAGANVTLGIPRLREIIMTASRSLSTPTMSVPILPQVEDREATRLMRSFTKLTLKELLSSRKGITVTESLERNDASGMWERCYQITLRLHPAERIQEAFGLGLLEIARVVTKAFLPKVSYLMKLEIRKSNKHQETMQSTVKGGEASDFMMEDVSGGANEKADDGKKMDEYEDEEAAEEDGVSGAKFGHRKEMVSYGDMDDEDRALRKSTVENDDNADYDKGDEDEENPATVSDDDEMEESEYRDFSSSGSALKVDRRRNILYLRPLRVDPGNQPLLMIGLVEKAASAVVVRERKSIDRAFINEEEDGRGRCLQTAGVNFGEIWKLSAVDHPRLLSNDIWAMRCAYGVEAARSTIVQQIRGVFAVYGITVDPRHLSLIADYMTYNGDYKAMNRIGMKENSSAFLQMSFETTAAFLVEAALTGIKEPLNSPSANIVVGNLVKHGTGAFDCLVKAT